MAEKLDTRARIKIAAQRLFAERGVEAVAVREIITEAGAKNGGSLNYYFGSKEGLIDELLADVFRAYSEDWLDRWSQLERRGGPACVRDVMDVIVVGPEQLLKIDRHPTSAQFLASVLHTRRKVVSTFLKTQEFTIYSRLLRYIQELRSDIPPSVMRQRIIFLAWYLISVESAYEAFLASGRKVAIWTDYDPRTNIVDTATAIIEAPVTVAEVKRAPTRKSRRPEPQTRPGKKRSS